MPSYSISDFHLEGRHFFRVLLVSRFLTVQALVQSVTSLSNDEFISTPKASHCFPWNHTLPRKINLFLPTRFAYYLYTIHSIAVIHSSVLHLPLRPQIWRCLTHHCTHRSSNSGCYIINIQPILLDFIKYLWSQQEQVLYMFCFCFF